LHLQELSEQIIKENLLDDEFINTYRKFYQKPDWDDKYLMIQNILYVTFRNDFIEMKNFKDFIEQLKIYIDDNYLNYKLGVKGRNWIWIFDKDEYFNNKYVHYEFLLIENKISIDLHFEKSVKTARELHNLIGELPDFLEWKKWQKSVDSITHKNKVDFNSEDCIQKTIETLNELFEYTYPLLVEKANLLKGIPENNNPMENIKSDKKTPLNQILFGAPGTGKTYNTKRIAVEIINGKKPRNREEINAEYEDLINAKQIVFTTFHQSLSYEDFIEGIKPETTDGNVTYEVKDGIFKRLVNQAKQIHSVKRTDINWEGVNFYKMSLGGKNNPLEHQYCITNNLGGISWGGNNDLKNLSNIKDWAKYRDTFIQYFPNVVEENRYNIQASFILNKMRDGDIVIATKGNHIIDSIGKVTGGYHYDEDNPTSLIHFRKIDWFLTDLNTAPDRFFKKQISQQSIYQFYNEDVKIEAFKELTSTSERTNDKRFVLIIDEINRGNVSAIFGELITLLEEDKRKGNKEQTEVTLPYSNDKFSVPNNVYIIGTMNTADRSVEALDTALRRRFSFVEMQPDPEVLSNSEYQDIDLKQLLETINQRIEVLVDKDHQIGHSYFIGIQNLDDLKLVFKDKIIPLLEEYFYGDFGKIGLVLGGSFIYQEENTAKFPKNFTYENDFLEDKKVYRFTLIEYWSESTFISVYED